MSYRLDQPLGRPTFGETRAAATPLEQALFWFGLLGGHVVEPKNCQVTDVLCGSFGSIADPSGFRNGHLPMVNSTVALCTDRTGLPDASFAGTAVNWLVNC